MKIKIMIIAPAEATGIAITAAVIFGVNGVVLLLSGVVVSAPVVVVFVVVRTGMGVVASVEDMLVVMILGDDITVVV